MRIIRGLPSAPPDRRPSAVALGVFDGVHLGHRAILGAAVAHARASGAPAIACTFDPHPLEVLQPGRAPLPITTLDERLALIAQCGIDGTVVLSFTAELAAVEPEAFVKDVVVGRLAASQVVVGFNHRFGRGARGDAALLRELGGRLGFRVDVVEPLTVDGVEVSSTAIRAALGRGDLDGAARMLGRPYTLPGKVVPGAGRGRTLGFPTANVAPDRPVLLATGVYAAVAEVGAERRRAVVNIGVRPTFGEDTLAVEAYLLDFSGNLYGQPIRLTFVSRVREERRFPSVDALRAQIEADVATARQRL
ncbi:MAG TPA: bifunctional riboflavin kinase/FAD synthetase [Methylomirabilota bacterium]|nr:bifunctional riboflavin kinase/FAD synthetase [Methylomirabilota bacterium]